jgi:hypothetical protein
MYTNLYLVEELGRQRGQQLLEAAAQALADQAAGLASPQGQDETQHAMRHAASVIGPPREGEGVAGAE